MIGNVFVKWALMVVVFSLAACASQPNEIATSYVSPVQYQNYDCEQLAVEASRVNRRASDLHGILEETADDDEIQMGVGLILFWPTLFFLEGGDGPQAQEYARLKGERDAIQQSMTAKKCSTEEAWVMPSTQNQEMSIEKRLEKLDGLLRDGLLTEKEAAAKRQEILSDL